MDDWLTPVDEFLHKAAHVRLEQVLCDGCLAGRLPPELAEMGNMDLELARRVAEEDGGAAVTYRGILSVAGVRYSFEVLLFADLDGTYSVASVWSFAPTERSAEMMQAA